MQIFKQFAIEEIFWQILKFSCNLTIFNKSVILKLLNFCDFGSLKISCNLNEFKNYADISSRFYEINVKVQNDIKVSKASNK